MIRKKQGFTMVELSFAIVFISGLLLLLTFIILQVTSIYQKTMSVKAINDTGRELIDQFSRSISASTLVGTSSRCASVDEGYRDACVEDGAFRFIYHQYESDNFKVSGKELDKPVPTSGTFCTGLYSYIWNSGYVLNKDNAGADIYRATIRYVVDDNDIERNNFRLIRVYDPIGAICRSNVNGATYSFRTEANNLVYELPAGEEPTELLDSAEADIALYDLRIFHPARHAYSGQAYYSGTFVLATLQGQVDIFANGDFCKAPPSNDLGEFTYCAINKFNFASQATGESDD